MPNDQFNPLNRSTQDPNSFLDPMGNIRRRDRDYLDPNAGVRSPLPMPSVPGGNSFGAQYASNLGLNGTLNVNTAPPGSAIEQYYKRMVELMPSNRQSALGDAGSILGSFASDRRDNRVIGGNFQGEYDRSMLEREAARNRIGLDSQSEYDRLKLLSAADKRDSTSDAMQKIQLGGWLQQGGNASAPGGAHRAVSDQERAGATGLIDQMHAQLSRPEFEPTKFEGNYDFNPTDPSKYAKPGVLENIGQYGGMALGGLSALDRLTGGRSGDYIGGLMGKIPGLGGVFGGGSKALSGMYGMSAPNIASQGISSGGLTGAGSLSSNLLGKALPIAGIAAGSYGLMKNRGTGTNVMNGAQTGAGIGMMAGGPIGAGIGAGVGALAGWGRGAFGVSEQEKQGRTAASESRQALTAGATPQQQQEAQAAGYANPQDALAQIVLRDRLTAAGQAPEMSDQLMAQLHQAEKKGPEAVQSVMMQISQMLQPRV